MVVLVDHDDADARIEVLPELSLVRLTWKEPVPGLKYREIMMRLLATVRHHGLKHWLSDGRCMGPILFADQTWTMQEFVPQLIQVGLERVAIVSSADVLNRIAVDRMVNATSAGVPYSIAFFEDPSIAQLWLMDRTGAHTPVGR